MSARGRRRNDPGRPGFGDVKLFAYLESLGFDYAIGFRGNIQVAAENGETRPAADWTDASGRARMLRGVEVTPARRKVPAVGASMQRT